MLRLARSELRENASNDTNTEKISALSVRRKKIQWQIGLPCGRGGVLCVRGVCVEGKVLREWRIKRRLNSKPLLASSGQRAGIHR